MKIYNKLVLEIESGAVLEEDSFEYSGAIAHCGGGDAPDPLPMDPSEVALNREQLAMLQEQRAYQKELEPFMLESMGYTRDATGKIIKGAPTAEDIMMDKQLALSGYDKAGNRLTEEQQLSYMTEAEKQSYNLNKLNNQRTMDAYNGKLAISPALEEELTAEEAQATEMLQRKLGSNWALSTSGQNMMKQIKQKGNLVREEARRGQITTGEGISATRSSINAHELNNRESLATLNDSMSTAKMNRMMGFATGSTIGMNDSLSMSSKLAAERANQQNVAMQQWQGNVQHQNSNNSMYASGAGVAVMAAIAAA